jgi:hypothetical protein
MIDDERDPSEYPAYEVRLARVVYLIWSGLPLWGDWVWLDRWTQFSGDKLRKKYGRLWSLRLARVLHLTRFEVRGLLEDGTPVPLSKWRLEEPSRQGMLTGTESKRDEYWEIAGLPETIVAYHLRDCRKLSPDATVMEMRRRHYPEVSRGNVARKRGYGADAVKRKGRCPACDVLKDGQERREAETIA